MKKNILKLVILATLITLFVILSSYRAFLIKRNIDTADQTAYLLEAGKLKKQNYKNIFNTGRNRMPLYSFIVSSVYTEDITDFYFRAITINIILSLIFLSLISLIFYQHFDFFTTVSLTSMVGLSVFISRSAFVQTEILFYFFLFFSLYFFAKLLHKPTLKIAVFSGILASLSFYSKASALLFVFIFTLTYLFKLIFKKSIKEIKYLIIFLLSFIILIYPYINQSKKMFGSYFYNVNSTFYMWYDSWDEALDGTNYFGIRNGIQYYGDRYSYPIIPDGKETPSFSNYLKNHSTEQIKDRFEYGFSEYAKRFYYRIGRFNIKNISIYKGSLENAYDYGASLFIIILLLYLITTLVFNRKSFYIYFKKYFFPILFLVTSSLGYLISLLWYSYIVCEDRFTLAIFIPYIFFTSLFINKITKKSQAKDYKILYIIISVFIAIYIELTMIEVLRLLKQ